MDDLAVLSNATSGATNTSFIGWVDDIIVEPRAVYTGSSLTVPTERYRIETVNLVLIWSSLIVSTVSVVIIRLMVLKVLCLVSN